MSNRTLTIVHPGTTRSSVAADLLASLPNPRSATVCEEEWPHIGTIRAVVDWNGSAPLSVRWYDGEPKRGYYDVRESGVDFVIKDLLRPQWRFEAGDGGLGEASLGIICVRSCQAELEAVRQMIVSPHPRGWFILPLSRTSPAAGGSIMDDLAPVIPVPFGNRPHRAGKRAGVEAGVSPGVAGEMTCFEVTDAAIAEGKALWHWLSPQFGVGPLPQESPPVVVANDASRRPGLLPRS